MPVAWFRVILTFTCSNAAHISSWLSIPHTDFSAHKALSSYSGCCMAHHKLLPLISSFVAYCSTAVYFQHYITLIFYLFYRLPREFQIMNKAAGIFKLYRGCNRSLPRVCPKKK